MESVPSRVRGSARGSPAGASTGILKAWSTGAAASTTPRESTMPMDARDALPALAFGPFVLDRSRKQLLENDRPLRLGGRAFDLLAALTERSGDVISRQELEARVWPRTIVEETSLRVHISALRKV